MQFLSHELHPLAAYYGGKQGFWIEPTKNMLNGDTCNQEKWILDNHMGTHVDCPKHFSLQGNVCTHYSPEDWVFNAIYLLEITCQPDELITPQILFQDIPTECQVLLIKTGFEQFRGTPLYWEHGPGLAPELAHWLKSYRPQLKVIGIDFISITAFAHRDIGRIAHRAFLAPSEDFPGYRVIEDMKLSAIHTHPKELIIAPLLVASDGSPVTVIAKM